MLPQRVRSTDWLAAACGLAVLVSLWLEWFDAAGAGVTGWRAFSVTDILLALAGAAALTTLVLTLANESPTLPVAGGVITLALAAIGLLVVLVRVAINEPGPNALVGLEAGAYIGLLAVLALFSAALAQVRDEASPHQPTIVPTELPAPPKTAA